MIKHLYELLSNEKSNEEKLLILIGNIIQNNKISIKQLELKQLIKKLVKNIKVCTFMCRGKQTVNK